mgnify:CR=1 FL=1
MIQFLVIGYNSELCTEKAYKIAYEVGKEIGKRKIVLITGGLGGVMEAASKGAKEEGGIVIGIIPSKNKEEANRYCDIVICTGIGYARNFITAYSADAVIIVGGGAGTLTEASIAYLEGKPIIAIKGSGGIADKLINDKYIDERKIVKVYEAKDPKEAVELALSMIKNVHK